MRAQERQPCIVPYWIDFRPCDEDRPCGEDCNGDTTRWVTVGALLEWSGHGLPQTYVVEGTCPGCDHPVCRDCRPSTKTVTDAP
jgi:hypothetical protein